MLRKVNLQGWGTSSEGRSEDRRGHVNQTLQKIKAIWRSRIRERRKERQSLPTMQCYSPFRYNILPYSLFLRLRIIRKLYLSLHPFLSILIYLKNVLSGNTELFRFRQTSHLAAWTSEILRLRNYTDYDVWGSGHSITPSHHKQSILYISEKRQ